jgi:hypothetical protein
MVIVIFFFFFFFFPDQPLQTAGASTTRETESKNAAATGMAVACLRRPELAGYL